MAWAHTTGEAASIAAWFAVFEAWISGTVGWTIEAGSGTNDLIVRSVSELGGLTMLWARVWQATTRIHVELRDDLAGTHVTTRGDYIETDGVPFVYWITADMDAFIIVGKAGAGYRQVYAGLVEPFALNPADETYRMVVAGNFSQQATILRLHTGVWDQDDLTYCSDRLRDQWFDQWDQSFAVSGIYFGDNVNIAGQFKHVSCYFRETPSINPEDKLISDWSDSEWTFFRQIGTPAGLLWALHTAGTLPAGQADGAHFAHQRGPAVSRVNFFDTVLPAFLTAVGWVVDNFPGSPYANDKRCYSQGESGTEDIWVRVIWNAVGQIGVAVMDDATGTHAAFDWWTFNNADFAAATYWITADRDCLLFTLDRLGSYAPWWAGMGVCNSLTLPSTPYKLFVTAAWSGVILRAHDGTWNLTHWAVGDDGVPADNSNPSAYDGTTYFAWPIMFFHDAGHNPFERINSYGRFKYFFETDGGAIAVGDSITWGAQAFRMFTFGGREWLMRTDWIEGINFPGRRLYPINPYMSQWMDSGFVLKDSPTAVIRGDQNEPFNVRLRGVSRRIDPPR